MALLNVQPDETRLAQAAAERITGLVEDAIAARGSGVVCLTGGSTPRALYLLLGSPDHEWRARIDWTRLHLFWGDERHVPPEHPDSNYGMARDAMLRHVPTPAWQIHRMRGELPDAAAAAREYDRALRAGFEAAGRSDLRFDVMLLGLGPDAHIASIFPGSPLLDDHRRPRERASTEPRVAAVPGPDPGSWRITLSPAAVVDAERILMLVAGASKADAVHAAIEKERRVREWPAQLLREEGDRVEWLIDRDAAALLSRQTRRGSG